MFPFFDEQEKVKLEKEVILEFDPFSVDAKYAGKEEMTGANQFVCDSQVPLSALTNRCKRKILDYLNIKKGDPRYRLLYS